MPDYLCAQCEHDSIATPTYDCFVWCPLLRYERAPTQTCAYTLADLVAMENGENRLPFQARAIKALLTIRRSLGEDKQDA